MAEFEMFCGEYHHQLDEKGRFRIPAKLRAQLGDKPFITSSKEGCLFVFPTEEAKRIFENKFGETDIDDFGANRDLREMTRGAFTAEEDKQGRILLPTHLAERAGITKNIVTVGVYKRVEIWSEERWNEYIGADK